MDILFGLVGIVFLFTALAGFIFFVIFMARKIGVIKIPEKTDENTPGTFGAYITHWDFLKKSLIFRLSLIAVLVALLNLPLGMVRDVVRERNQLYHHVLQDIASTWGKRQKLEGPVLLVPYTEKFISNKVLTDEEGNERKVNKTSFKHRTAIILPDKLNIDASLFGQTRQRGLYKSLVYTSDISIQGDFKRPDIASLSDHIDKIHWDRAWFSLGLSDTQAINKVSQLNWDINESGGEKVDFEPGTRINKTIANGFHAPLNLTGVLEQGSYKFALEININGSEGFFFSPVGKITEVNLKSDWPHPSFQGNVLPEQHKIDTQGFTAHWSIPHLARNYPQLWTLGTQNFNMSSMSAGVNLFESVSLYLLRSGLY